MTLTIPRASTILFAFPLCMACTTPCMRCASESPAPVDLTPTASVTDAQPSDASIETDAGGGDAATAINDTADLCDRIAGRREIVTRWGHEPWRLFRGGVRCDDPESPHTCGAGRVDEDGFFGYSTPENGPGVRWFFIVRDDDVITKHRITCTTISLTTAARPEPGVERCETVKVGLLDGMTAIVDNRCDDLRMIFFDKNYRAADPNAEKLTDCDTPLPERLAGAELLCKPVNQ